MEAVASSLDGPGTAACDGTTVEAGVLVAELVLGAGDGLSDNLGCSGEGAILVELIWGRR